MNKAAIKNFAIWARNKLIADITYKASLLGITEKEIKEVLPQSTKDVQFIDIGTKEPYSISGIEIKQREKLAETIISKAKQSDYNTAYKAVVEEVAYTWFNRLIAVRFMEVNDYLPSRIRVLSSESVTKIEPDLVTSPFDSDLDFSPYEKDRIVQLKHDNKLDELFQMLFIKQCNALNAILPNLFQKTNDYTELLLNVSFADKDGVVYRLVHDISEDDFNVSKEGQVEIIGWLYQYYNTEPKDEAFALLKKNVKITKERIPAATQLFTPDWIVRYMVENSLGRLWLEGHPNNALKSKWRYYLDEAEQEEDVQRQLEAIREEYKTIKPEDIKVIDPCMGSGHILVYAFDVLMQIYESCGYSQRDAARSILKHNIYGLDIDNRAYQLAYFAIMMKARQYNRRILDGETDCHVYAIQESNDINRNHLKYFGAGMSDTERETAILQIEELLDTFIGAKEYGSILNVKNYNWELLYRFVGSVKVTGQLSLDSIKLEDTKEQLHILVEIGDVIAHKYDVVVTNPPYMASTGIDSKLSEYIKRNYKNSKTDIFAVFIERCKIYTKKNCYFAMITQHTWMFLGSYEILREKILLCNIISLLHFGIKAFEEIGNDVVQTCSFVFHNTNIKRRNARFCRLIDYKDSRQKEKEFFNNNNYFNVCIDKFYRIPGITFAYWVSDSFFDNFSVGTTIENYGEFTGSQNITGNNELFLRYFWEVPDYNIKNSNWVFYAKGGDYRKYYGNLEMVVDWRESARKFYQTNKTSNLLNEKFWFREGITYSAVTSRGTGFRYLPKNCIFDKGGPSITLDSKLLEILALLNSKVAELYFKVLNPSINLQVKDIKALPIILPKDDRVEKITKQTLSIAKKDWDSFEISFDFTKHPFCKIKLTRLKDAFDKWREQQEAYLQLIRENEYLVNEIYADLYNLKEIKIEFEDRDIPVREADLGRDIRSFISYAVGCMFGRYSLDVEGLAYAGGQWDDSKYSTFIPVKDNIIPITDEEYFEDDIVGLFVAFVKKVYGAETLEENLDFIAKALDNKGNTSREIIRNYFLKDFFKDHCKVYQNRPIYWLFDSGKANGFKALIYLHRYDENTIGNLRIDYLHKMQRIYESEIARMQETIENSNNAREVAAAEKRKEKLTKQLKETKEYDEKIAHLALARISIDLDDGVKVNYEKIQTGTDGKKLEVLAKI